MVDHQGSNVSDSVYECIGLARYLGHNTPYIFGPHDEIPGSASFNKFSLVFLVLTLGKIR